MSHKNKPHDVGIVTPGDGHVAKNVTQSVYIALAHKGQSLSDRTLLMAPRSKERASDSGRNYNLGNKSGK